MRVIADYGLRLGQRHRVSLPRGRALAAVRRYRGGAARQRSSLDFLFFSSILREETTRNSRSLERLVPKVERAHTLLPDATQTISRLIERQSVVGGAGDQSHQMRRKAAIERLIRAMQAKQDNSTAGTVGAAMNE